MTDFLFHHVNDEERKRIRKEAKEIMNNFSKKLSKVDKKIQDSLIERNDFEREESDKGIRDEKFRKIMFENTPNKKGDFFVVEKKKW